MRLPRKPACFIAGPVRLKEYHRRRVKTGSLDDLISSLSGDSVVREVHTCVFWTAVLAQHCGLASTFHEPHPYHRPVRNAGRLTGLPAVELAQYAGSDNVLEASIGLAPINSLICVDEATIRSASQGAIFSQGGKPCNHG